MKSKFKLTPKKGMWIGIGFVILWTLLGGIQLKVSDRRGSRYDEISLHIYKVPQGWRQPEKKSFWGRLVDKAKDKAIRKIESKLDE